MRATVTNDIYIHDVTKDFLKDLEKILTYNNPDYAKKQRMGLWVGNVPKTLSMIVKKGNDVIIPFGMLPYIWKNKELFNDDIMFECHFMRRREIDYKSGITLFDYQIPAVESAIKHKQGVIIAPCGSGKTQIGLEIAARIKGMTLWLTHTQDLLTQSMERAKSVFGLDPSQYGTITAGKIDLGSAITFATVQTMSKVDLSTMRDYFDCIIVDECHHACGTPTKLMMFYNVITTLSARWKYGLTATAKRYDGLERSMYAILGPCVYEISKEDVAQRTCPVNVIMRNVDMSLPQDVYTRPDGTIDYSKLITGLISDNQRNGLIVDDICRANGASLVLSERIDHMNTLYFMLNKKGKKCLILKALSGAKNRDERKAAINSLKNGDVDAVIASYTIAKEGLDIPNLRNVFFATPTKNEVTVTQAAGRVARVAEGKEYGVVYDYVDDLMALTRYWNFRKRIYKKLKYSIDFGEKSMI